MNKEEEIFKPIKKAKKSVESSHKSAEFIFQIEHKNLKTT